jgi:hypothetical protein
MGTNSCICKFYSSGGGGKRAQRYFVSARLKLILLYSPFLLQMEGERRGGGTPGKIGVFIVVVLGTL